MASGTTVLLVVHPRSIYHLMSVMRIRMVVGHPVPLCLVAYRRYICHLMIEVTIRMFAVHPVPLLAVLGGVSSIHLSSDG